MNTRSLGHTPGVSTKAAILFHKPRCRVALGCVGASARPSSAENNPPTFSATSPNRTGLLADSSIECDFLLHRIITKDRFPSTSLSFDRPRSSVLGPYVIKSASGRSSATFDTSQNRGTSSNDAPAVFLSHSTWATHSCPACSMPRSNPSR